MKKLLCVAMALCLMLTLLAACSGKADTPADDKTSNPTNSEPSDDTAEVVDIADFEGTWKLGNGTVACYTVNAADKTVTAYADNGIEIGTFAAVPTADGLVLKMGAFGLVTLKDPTELTITSVPTATYDIKGTYDMIFGEHSNLVLTVNAADWSIDSESYKDSGAYEISNGEAILSPTKELGGNVYHKILGGGKVLQAYQPSSRVYIEKEYAETQNGKAMKNYFDLIMNKWVASDDEEYVVEFTGKGTVLITGVEMGIWYPTATGATAEFTDGSNQYVEFSDNGIEFYYKDFVRQ